MRRNQDLRAGQASNSMRPKVHLRLLVPLNSLDLLTGAEGMDDRHFP